VTGHMLHEIFILAANGAHKGHWKKTLTSLSGAAQMLSNNKVCYAMWRIDVNASSDDSRDINF
jgi:hypothetical protein